MANSKIERFLIDLMLTYREIDEDMWLVEDPAHGLNGVVVMHAPPLVVIRVVVMPAPKEERRLEFFTKLLELNANDILHGAYALENNEIVLIDTLEYDTMNFEDFRASLDAMALALSQHYSILSPFRT